MPVPYEDHPMDGIMSDDFDAKQEQKMEQISQALMAAAKTPDSIREFFSSQIEVLSELPKAKAAKVVRSWVDKIADMEIIEAQSNVNEVQIALCEAVIEWTKQEKRSFLKHRVQVKLAWIYLESRKLTEGMAMLETLSYDVKKLEEKVLLVEVHLIQSKMFYEVRNIARAKAALTACRANANSVHIAAQLQADIEFTGGVLAAAEKEYHVAHSYFQESYDGYMTVKGADQLVALSAACMFLMKLMDMKTGDFDAMAKSKSFLSLHQSPEVSAMLQLGDPIKKKDLKTFRQLRESNDFLNSNPHVKGHLVELEERLLGEVIVRLLSAYSRCGIAHVANVLNLDEVVVHRKLTNLILDGKLNASVAEDEGVITIEEPKEEPVAMKDALDTIKNLSAACDVIELIAQKPVQTK